MQNLQRFKNHIFFVMTISTVAFNNLLYQSQQTQTFDNYVRIAPLRIGSWENIWRL